MGLPRRVRRGLRLLWVASCALGALGVLTLGYFAWAGVLGTNLRAVAPGRYYRSGRMDGADLRRTIEELGIRRVINLCGKQHAKAWYDDELAVCAALGVRHDDLRMSPTALPSPRVVRRLIEAFDAGPFPLLVHCGGGADRAGFAAALFEIVEEGREPAAAARAQLSWRFGHVAVAGHARLDRFFALYPGNAADAAGTGRTEDAGDAPPLRDVRDVRAVDDAGDGGVAAGFRRWALHAYAAHE